MIAVRLVRLIEDHSEDLTEKLLIKFNTSPRTADFRKIPSQDLRRRCHEILGHLSEWLLSKTSPDIEHRYGEIGSLRAAQGVSLADVIWGIVLMKEHIWDFLQREGFLRGPLEIYGAMELQRLLDRFFDHAICYCAEGYESGKREAAEKGSSKHPAPMVNAV